MSKSRIAGPEGDVPQDDVPQNDMLQDKIPAEQNGSEQSGAAAPSERGEPVPKDDQLRGDSPDGERSQGSAGRRRATPIPDEKACVAAVAQLPGLVALGYLTPAKSNAIRASYREILQYHQNNQTRTGSQAMSNADVSQLLQSDPRLLSLLEPLLTDEQIAAAVKGS